MFNHVGKKIQTVILVVFFVHVVVSCILGLVLGSSIYSASDEMGIAFVVGAVVIALSIFVGWLSVLILFAFGKIEEHCEEQCELLKILVGKSSHLQE